MKSHNLSPHIVPYIVQLSLAVTACTVCLLCCSGTLEGQRTRPHPLQMIDDPIQIFSRSKDDKCDDYYVSCQVIPLNCTAYISFSCYDPTLILLITEAFLTSHAHYYEGLPKSFCRYSLTVDL